MYTDAFLGELEAGLQRLAPAWNLSPGTEITLLNISENATFKATDPERAAPVILRVHRPAYHSPAEIEAELAWIEAIRTEHIVDTPKPLSTEGDGHIANFEHGDDTRHVVAFEFMTGREPDESDDLVPWFVDVGKLTAKLHSHAQSWQRPSGFVRKTWTFDVMHGDEPIWGHWRDAMGLEPEGAAILERTAEALRTWLHGYGTSPERFGLIHGDLRLANLLVEGERIGVIDFDDCGFGWFAYDFAATVSFIETDPRLDAMMEAWVEGYRSVASWSDADAAALPTFVMLRRLLLTAWIASHAETPTAQELGVSFTHGTLEIAERFLSRQRA